MSVQFVIDMNLPSEWVAEFARHGWNAVHWSVVGDPSADDSVVMEWALKNDRVVFTHDLDFGTMLALTQADGPSVLQIRGRNVMPEDVGPKVTAAVRAHETALSEGALVVVDEKKNRVRILPI